MRIEDLLGDDLRRPWRAGDGGTRAELAAGARHLAARLGGAGRVVLSCRTAEAFVPGLLAAWHAGATVELLPNVQAGTLDRVDADAGVAHVLHDDPARQGRSAKAIFVPDGLRGGGGAGGAAAPAGAWPELAVQMSTSGTTERPRVVGKTMAQLLDEVAVLARVFPAPRCALSTVPLSHLYGLLFGALLPLRLGARLVSHDALLPADLAALIARASADLLISTPAHLRAMADAAMPRDLRVISSGAKLPAELHLRLLDERGWSVTDVLGSTETGGIARREHPLAAWTPLPGVRVSAAEEGELRVESPWAEGGRAELPEQIELRGDGTFQYLGRASALVKIAGKRAHADAIEAAARAVPGVTDVAVLVHEAPGREPRVALAYCAAGDEEPLRVALVAALRREFDAVFAPRILRRVAAIPRTERGKVQAEALRALLGLGGAPTREVPLARAGDGRYLAQIAPTLEFFHGHFDALAILPGAVLIERVVWPAAKLELSGGAALRGVRRLRFRRPVFPGQELAVELRRSATRSDQLTFEVSCGAAVVASGQLLVK